MPKSNHIRKGLKRKRGKCQQDGWAGMVGKPCSKCGGVVSNKLPIRFRNWASKWTVTY